MAYVQLQQILNSPNMCGVIVLTKSPIPDPFDDPAYDYVDKECHGNQGQYTQYTAARNTARITNYGSASQNQQLRELGTVAFTIPWLANNIVLEPSIYINLLAYDDLKRQDMGITEVKRQVEATREYIDNWYKIAKSAMLFNGGFTWDAQGNYVPPGGSPGPNTTGMNYNVPVGNQGQLDIFQTGNPVISTPWNNYEAKIPQQLSTLTQQSTQLTGYTAEYAYYGVNVPQFMTGNQYVQPYLARAQFGAMTPGMQFVSDGTLPEKLLGYKWVPAFKSYWLDQNNAVQTYVGNDAVTFTPPPSKVWVASLVGTTAIPTKPNITNSYETSFQDAGIIEQPGKFAYVVQTYDPAGMKIVYGDLRAPILKVPAAIFISTVATGS